MTTPTSASRSRLATLCVLTLAVLSLAQAGCRRTLFTEDLERTPFQRYDRVQDRDVEPYVRDEFGRRRPNLRARLLADET